MAKRQSGEGTIWIDKKGLWRGELTIGYDNKGKRLKKNFSSKDKEILQKKINDEKYKLNRNMVTNNDYILIDWIYFWLENYKSNIIKDTTRDYYEYAVKNISIDLCKTKLDKIKTMHIQQLYNALANKGLSESSIMAVHKVLNQSLQQAIVNEMIIKNPCKGVIIPKNSPKKVEALTLEEQNLFVSALNPGNTYHNLFLCLINTGLRHGEALALTWNDIDVCNGMINVHKNMVRVKNRDKSSVNSKRTILKINDTTKTASGVRSIPINKGCAKALNGQSKEALFVFSSQEGNPLCQSNVRRAFNSLLKKLKMNESLSIHSLRHTFATRLLEQNADMKVVSNLLGHKSVKTTYDIYSHVQPELKKETISKLDNLVR